MAQADRRVAIRFEDADADATDNIADLSETNEWSNLYYKDANKYGLVLEALEDNSLHVTVLQEMRRRRPMVPIEERSIEPSKWQGDEIDPRRVMCEVMIDG